MPGSRTLTPAFVTRAFEADLADTRQCLGALEEDLILFQDVRHLKEALRHSRTAPMAAELALFEEMLASTRGRGRRGRR